MRLAYEVRNICGYINRFRVRTAKVIQLGFANATLFSKRVHLRFLSLDGICFEQPVSIGSILRLRSQVTHTSHKEYPAVVVRVICDTLDREN